MKREIVQLTEGWNIEAQYELTDFPMTPEVKGVHLMNPNNETMDITDVYKVLIPNLMTRVWKQQTNKNERRSVNIS